MTVAWVSQGTVGTGSTSVTPGLPASLATGDGVLIQVVTKPDTATIVTPTDWTAVPDANVAGGGGTTGNGVGPTRQAWFFREKSTTWSTMPAIAVTSGNASAAIASRYTKAAGTTWDLAAASGVFGTAATTQATDTSFVVPTGGFAVGDLLVGGQSVMDEAPTWSSQLITNASFAAVGTATERSEAVETTTGNDVGGHYFTSTVANPLAAGATAWLTALASIATRGTSVCIRLREVAPPSGTSFAAFGIPL